MSIRFECAFCGKKLKVGDNAAGKKTSCPECGAALVVPESAGVEVVEEAPPANPSRPREEAREAEREPSSGRRPCPACGQMIPASAIECRFCDEVFDPKVRKAKRKGKRRSGPPWETDDSLPERFFGTAKDVLTQPTTCFTNMNRSGGVGTPLVYALIGGSIGNIAQQLYSHVMPDPADLIGGGGADPAQNAPVAVVIALVPVAIVITLFVGSAINHIMLMLVGAEEGFETTFRVNAYVMGSTGLIELVPFLGAIVAAFWTLAVLIVGYSAAHGIGIGRAILAVFLPLILCCGLWIGLLAFAGAAGAMRAGGM